VRVSLHADLIADLDFEAAVVAAIRSPPEFFPSRVIEDAAESRVVETAEYLTGAYERGFEVSRAEILYANKAGRGLRPVAEVAFRERVLLHALVDLVSTSLPAWERDGQAYQAFQAGPADDAGETGYVVLADVSNFYEYVDHRLLLDQLVDSTGEAEVANALGVVLGGLMDRSFGLPQGYWFSDALSEVFIDPVERRMIRRGWPTWRFADDFRIVANDWTEAQDAVEALAAELRRVGLHVNEEKLYTIGTAKYSGWVSEPDQKLEQVSEEAEIDLEDWSPYVGLALDDAQDGEVVAAAGMRLLDLWSEVVDGGASLSGLDAWVYRRLIGTAIGYLRAAKSPDGLGLVPKLLSREPVMTDVVAMYLADLVDQNPDPVFHSVLEILETVRLSSWQALWLFEVPMSHPDPPPWMADWLRPYLEINRTDAVRARAALALATMDAIDQVTIANVFETVGLAARPDLARAVSLLGADAEDVAATIKAENLMMRWIVEDGLAEQAAGEAIEEAPF
jgi:hypothetical protein